MSTTESHWMANKDPAMSFPIHHNGGWKPEINNGHLKPTDVDIPTYEELKPLDYSMAYTQETPFTKELAELDVILQEIMEEDTLDKDDKIWDTPRIQEDGPPSQFTKLRNLYWACQEDSDTADVFTTGSSRTSNMVENENYSSWNILSAPLLPKPSNGYNQDISYPFPGHEHNRNEHGAAAGDPNVSLQSSSQLTTLLDSTDGPSCMTSPLFPVTLDREEYTDWWTDLEKEIFGGCQEASGSGLGEEISLRDCRKINTERHENEALLTSGEKSLKVLLPQKNQEKRHSKQRQLPTAPRYYRPILPKPPTPVQHPFVAEDQQRNPCHNHRAHQLDRHNSFDLVEPFRQFRFKLPENFAEPPRKSRKRHHSEEKHGRSSRHHSQETYGRSSGQHDHSQETHGRSSRHHNQERDGRSSRHHRRNR